MHLQFFYYKSIDLYFLLVSMCMESFYFQSVWIIQKVENECHIVGSWYFCWDFFSLKIIDLGDKECFLFAGLQPKYLDPGLGWELGVQCRSRGVAGVQSAELWVLVLGVRLSRKLEPEVRARHWTWAFQYVCLLIVELTMFKYRVIVDKGLLSFY